jgi:hypothetical protein
MNNGGTFPHFVFWRTLTTYTELKLKCIKHMIAVIIDKINSTEWTSETICQCGNIVGEVSKLKSWKYRISTDDSEKYTVHRFGSVDYLLIWSHGYQLNQDGSIVDLGDNQQKFATIYMYGDDGCYLYVTEDTEFVDSAEDIKNMTWACRPAGNIGDDALFANINGKIIFLE